MSFERPSTSHRLAQPAMATCCPRRGFLLLFALLFASSALAKPRTGKRSSPSSPSPSSAALAKDPLTCDPDKLMVYKVTLATHWTRALFPKQYPEWRPPAQWSKVIGKPARRPSLGARF